MVLSSGGYCISESVCKTRERFWFCALNSNSKIHRSIIFQAFLTNEFAIEHPEHSGDVATLWTLIGDQIKILKEGMQVHEKCAPPEVRPLHDKLVKDLHKMTKIMVRWKLLYSILIPNLVLLSGYLFEIIEITS